MNKSKIKIHRLKILLLIIITIVAGVLILSQIGIFSAKAPINLGAENNRLSAPSNTKNSVSSQAEFFSKTDANVEYAKIPPLNYRGGGKAALAKLKELISADFKEAMLIEEKENYLRYEFKSGLMKFTDDVEFLLNEGENYIHFRSASRLGRNDFGKNRERMEEIRKKFLELNNEAAK